MAFIMNNKAPLRLEGQRYSVTSDDLQRIWQSHDWTLNRHSIKEALIIGSILGVIAPYNTSEAVTIAWRFLYWISVVLFAIAVSGVIARKLFPVFLARKMEALPAISIFSVVLALPITAAVLILDIFVTGLTTNPDGLTLQYAYTVLTEMEDGALGYLLLYVQVWVLTILIVGITALIEDKLLAGKTGATPAKPGHKFLKRLPAEIGNELVCLSMEDHYIRVSTRKGDTLILMRMADALSELEDYPGHQIHRSWWVATDAIEKVAKDGRKYIVHLTGGLTAPVSQTHQNKLKDLDLI